MPSGGSLATVAVGLRNSIQFNCIDSRMCFLGVDTYLYPLAKRESGYNKLWFPENVCKNLKDVFFLSTLITASILP